MPDDAPTRSDPNQLGGNSDAVSQDSLAAAIAYIGRDAETTGEEPFELRREAAITQRGALIRWARENGLMVSPDIWQGKAVTGASEHDVWHEAGEYWKATRPDHFGWTVLPGDDGKPESAEATPLEYLKRWRSQNRYFGDSARLRGVVETELGIQVVVSHPYVDGPYPEMLHIVEDMRSRGFVLVPGFTMGANAPSFYRADANLAVFDASEDNFILSESVPVPIDVIALIPGVKLRGQLLRMMSL